MSEQFIFYTECLNILSYLPLEVSLSTDGVEIKLSADDEKYLWKNQPLDFSKLPLPKHDALELTPETLRWKSSGLGDGPALRAAVELIQTLRELLLKENLQARFWMRPIHITANGFKEGSLPRTNALLKELSDDKLMVAEKKAFLVDLWRSTGPYLIADEAETYSFLDAASQIASVAIGHNHKSRGALLLRPEHQDAALNLNDWDIALALRILIREQSKLPHIYFVNSGAEAMETALRSCQMAYPERRHIIAFEGSFHGRTLVALHATHNPAKRLPFEIHQDLVSFLPFPEDKEPHLERLEPENWTTTWAAAQQPDFETRVSFWKKSNDILLKVELESLVAIRRQIVESNPLCVIIEPMQCEGGDRYASARYFRALRLLTRAFDVALVVDEVQCGFGLGGPFFWHSSFNLVDALGNADTPDAIFQAKKSQIGICATRFPMPFDDETAPASIHRGYIQALEVLDASVHPLQEKVTEHLAAFQRAIGDHLVSAPRSRGYAFAFDLPNAAILNALVGKRFPHGLLFYPAGDRTARFRLWVGTQDHELLEIFSNLYACFEDLARDGLIEITKSRADWLSRYPKPLQEKISHPSLSEHAIWPDFVLHKTPAELAKLSPEKWDRAYHKLATFSPQLILLAAEGPYDLSTPPKDFNELLERYSNDPSFTRLDLVWNGARFFGTQLEETTADSIRARSKELDALQAQAYEPARRTSIEQFLQLAADPRSIIHIGRAPDGHLIGISAAGAAENFRTVPMLDQDPDCEDPQCLYSVDLTLDIRHQGKGLGLRFKCEQFISCLRRGAHYLKSRNRYPEAVAMARLNFRLAGVITGTNHNDYGGDGTALYQSWSFKKTLKKRYRIGDVQAGALKINLRFQIL